MTQGKAGDQLKVVSGDHHGINLDRYPALRRHLYVRDNKYVLGIILMPERHLDERLAGLVRGNLKFQILINQISYIYFPVSLLDSRFHYRCPNSGWSPFLPSIEESIMIQCSE